MSPLCLCLSVTTQICFFFCFFTKAQTLKMNKKCSLHKLTHSPKNFPCSGSSGQLTEVPFKQKLDNHVSCVTFPKKVFLVTLRAIAFWLRKLYCHGNILTCTTLGTEPFVRAGWWHKSHKMAAVQVGVVISSDCLLFTHGLMPKKTTQCLTTSQICTFKDLKTFSPNGK